MFCARIFFVSLTISPVFAQPPAAPPRTVQASGEAVVNAKPDRAQITIGVVTQSATAKEAAAQNATQATRLYAALKQALDGHGDFKTMGYSISPQYESGPNKSPKLKGYRAENSVVVTVDDLSLVGEVVDAATNSGANNVNGISFTLKNEETARNEAFTAAALKARASAEAIARALNLQVLGVLKAQSVEAGAVHPFLVGSLNAATMATPIESGSLEIREAVLVTLQVQ